MLKAVNLGEDTDTVGAVAGGLAGVYYGIEAIPKAWMDLLPKKEWINELILSAFGCGAFCNPQELVVKSDKGI